MAVAGVAVIVVEQPQPQRSSAFGGRSISLVNQRCDPAVSPSTHDSLPNLSSPTSSSVYRHPHQALRFASCTSGAHHWASQKPCLCALHCEAWAEIFSHQRFAGDPANSQQPGTLVVLDPACLTSVRHWFSAPTEITSYSALLSLTKYRLGRV